MRTLVTVALAATFALPVAANAQAYSCSVPKVVEPSRPVVPDGPTVRTAIGGYTLAASWSPEFCRNPRDKGTMQCSGRNGRFGFVLHGLWPNARSGPYPQWCSTTPRPSPEVVRRNLCMTPVPWLIEHEWAKHGSCMAATPDEYYRTSARLWQAIQWPDADYLSRKKGLTTGDLRQEFVRANRGWKVEQVGVVVSQSGWLREVHLCLDRKFRPTKCKAKSFGPASSSPLKIWRGL